MSVSQTHLHANNYAETAILSIEQPAADPKPQPSLKMNPSTLSQFVTLIATNFDALTLQWVCAVANIDDAVLNGHDIVSQAHSLVEYASRHHSDIYALLHACIQENPSINWPHWRDLYIS